MERFHEILLSLAIGVSFGLIGATVGRAIALRRKRKNGQALPLTQNQQRLANRIYSIFKFLSRSIYVVLAISLIWTLYYMVLGIVDPGQTERATNVSQLIVSVITVFSILIAFFEFMHRDDGKNNTTSGTDPK